MSISKKEIESSVKDKELIEIRRKEIVNAAVDLFVRKGFHKRMRGGATVVHPL